MRPIISLVHDLPAQEDERCVDNAVDDKDEPNGDGSPGAPQCNGQEQMILLSNLS